MKPVDQDKFSSHEDPTQLGNCFSAAIASLLELSLKEVPFFRAMSDDVWFDAFWNFLQAHGYAFEGSIDVTQYKDIYEAWDVLHRRSEGVTGYFIVSGESPRGFKDGHAVVYKDAELAHDPHPSRAGLTTPWSIWMIAPNP